MSTECDTTDSRISDEPHLTQLNKGKNLLTVGVNVTKLVFILLNLRHFSV